MNRGYSQIHSSRVLKHSEMSELAESYQSFPHSRPKPLALGAYARLFTMSQPECDLSACLLADRSHYST